MKKSFENTARVAALAGAMLCAGGASATGASAGGASAGGASATGDFPTQARVEYVLGCMQDHGGQNYDTLYGCVCAVDKIDEKYTYQEYADVEMLSFLLDTPGEKGGVFRDAAPHSRDRVKMLAKVREAAEKSCFSR